MVFLISLLVIARKLRKTQGISRQGWVMLRHAEKVITYVPALLVGFVILSAQLYLQEEVAMVRRVFGYRLTMVNR